MRARDGPGEEKLVVGAPFTPDQLQVSLLREQVSDLLRQAIVEMRLVPGQRLIERELVESLGVSRATVREAIRQLAAEGLVTTIPQRGAVVAAPTLKEAEELYEIRAMLEGLAGRQFVERSSEAQVKALRRAFEGIRRVATSTGETWAMLQAKDRFYEALFAGAANDTAREVLGGLQARITVLRATSMSQDGRVRSTVEEIGRIVEAIEAQDPAAAEQACADHVRAAGRVVFEALRDASEGEAAGVP